MITYSDHICFHISGVIRPLHTAEIWNFLLVIWKNTEYNIGNALNINDGKFTAPVDGIYFFYLQVRSLGSNSAYIALYLNGSAKSYGYRDEDGENDTVTLSSQFKLNKGDKVWAYFSGYFNNPANEYYTFFEGHLIRQINTWILTSEIFSKTMRVQTL